MVALGLVLGLQGVELVDGAGVEVLAVSALALGVGHGHGWVPSAALQPRRSRGRGIPVLGLASVSCSPRPCRREGWMR